MIRRLESLPGTVSTVAGQAEAGFSGDGGPATAAKLGYTQGLAIDSSGSLFIADWSHRIRRVDASGGIITTVAGTGVRGSTGDDGRAVFARLSDPSGLAMDAAGNLFFAETTSHRIRAIRGPIPSGQGTKPTRIHSGPSTEWRRIGFSKRLRH